MKLYWVTSNEVLSSTLNKMVITFKSESETIAFEHSNCFDWFETIAFEHSNEKTECYVHIERLHFISYNFDEQQFGISSLLCLWFPWSGSVNQINLPPTSAWCSSFWWSKSMHSSARCMMSFSLVSGETWSPEDSIEQDLRGLTCLVSRISP